MAAARWYVVKTKVRQEAVAEEHLGRQGYSAWLPQIRVEHRSRGSWRQRLEPLFPGYLFVCLESGVHNFSPIRSTRGVANLVSFATRPGAMPDGAVERLQQLYGDEPPAATPLREGEAVRVARGAFSGWEGVFSATEADERVIIMLEILGQQQFLAFPRDDVMLA